MAASTSTTANPNNHCYDVFINHRGTDVKKTFASHLYGRLRGLGCRVFLDRSELQQGDSINHQIEEAIRTASVQVAIFSKGYADSNWCLDELVLMLNTGATVIPVFYDVEPSQLRWTQGEKGIYAKALHELEEKVTHDPETNEKKLRYHSTIIKNWREALSKAAGISGFELKECNGDEGTLLEKVVERVLEKVEKPRVEKPRLNVADYPTGLAEKVQDFENKILLQQKHSAKPQVVGIIGLGGVGKTTLAKQLFNLKSSDYDKSCFLPDIREIASTPSLILSLQKKLLESLIGSDPKIDNIDVGITTLEKHLSSHKALVILDDVDSESLVKKLFPVQTVLHADSLILITSRNRDVLTSSGVEDSLIYTLTGLKEEHSRELFCLHSFGRLRPAEGFESLVDRFLVACEGLPLSLKVFGALLCGKNTFYWEQQLNRLQQILPGEIKLRLKISFDALEPDEKNIFLDIACFFIRHNRDTAIRVWEGSGWCGSLGFENLQNRCLVTMDSENDIQMHGHLRDMGRDIAEELGRCAGKTRRLWHWTEQVIDGLSPPNHGIIVRGIKMDLSEYEDYKDVLGNIFMERLQLLDTEERILDDIMNRVKTLQNLIWLRWKNCPYSALPSSIPLKNLRVLQVSGSVLKKLWEEDSQPPLQLRELEISAPLRNIPKSIGRLKHLERIFVGRFLSGRVNLIELPEEFCDLKSLKALVLKECSRLESLPDPFGKLTTLEHIDLSFCRNLERLPDSFGRLMNLQHLDLSNCHDLKSLPDSFGRLGNLERIDLRGCHKLKSLPDSFGNLKKLQHINLSYCHGLRRLPDSFSDLSNLQYIDLSTCHNLNSLPDSFGKLTNLQRISLSNCHDLETLPNSFDDLKNLQHVDLSRCHNLERLPNSLTESKIVCLEGCPYLTM